MENFDDLIRIKTNDIKPGPGKILISEPFLFDYYFKRSVVLLAEHNKEGSFGVIINKPMSISFNEVVKDFPEFDARVFLGGPVNTNSLFYIHTLGDSIGESLEILDGLYWGGDLERVKELILLGQLDETNFRFFIGYSGWMPRQLEKELKRDSWLVSGINAHRIMTADTEKLWQETLLDLGEKYRHWINFPSEPALN
ncbi:MAG: YqgE/AlgH family protein [Bacteroidales bacterium]|nr:YqgE/AlgH family protein [Bacteroidales bacterium]